MYHSAGGVREGGMRPNPVEESVCRMWGAEAKGLSWGAQMWRH